MTRQTVIYQPLRSTFYALVGSICALPSVAAADAQAPLSDPFNPITVIDSPLTKFQTNPVKLSPLVRSIKGPIKAPAQVAVATRNPNSVVVPTTSDVAVSVLSVAPGASGKSAQSDGPLIFNMHVNVPSTLTEEDRERTPTIDNMSLANAETKKAENARLLDVGSLPGAKGLGIENSSPAASLESPEQPAVLTAPDLSEKRPPQPIAIMTNPFRIGEQAALGQNHQPGTLCTDAAKTDVTACVEPVIWPNEIADAFDVSSLLYRGQKAVVRYSGDRADRFYVVYDAENFTRISAYLQDTFGKADRSEHPMPVFGNPNAMNKMFRWQRNENGRTVVLELREFDDLRDMMPNERLGSLELFFDGDPQMFDTLQTSDFFLKTLSARQP